MSEEDSNCMDCAGSEVKFRLWTVKNITTLKNDVSWMKKVLSPSLYIALVSSVVTVALLILRAIGR